jgi:S-DNA-T family DNA segregation ATPase FtsK/SpoIIIE
LNKYARNLSIILAGTAGLLFFVIVLALFGVSAGGVSFLFRTFHLAAFYVPLYLAVCALILLKPRGMEKLLLTLNLSLLPFLNLALLLHVLSGNKSIFISRYLISELGAGLSVPFLLLLLLVECALIYKLVDFLFPDSSWFPIGRDISLWIKKKSHSLIESLPSHSFKDPIREEIYSKNPSEEGAEPGVGSFSIPDMPQPIPPVEIMDDSEIHDLIASVIKPDTSRKNGFNPNKTLSIDDVVNPIYEEGNSDSHTETADPPEDIVPVPDEDPGIEFLMDHEDSDLSASLENLEEDSQEDEDIQDEDYEEQGYITDRYEDLEALRDEPLLDDENPISIENKLYPEGESEKLGVLSPGMLPKHKRKKEYKVPVVGLLKEYPDDGFNEVDDFTRRQGRALEETLKEFKIEASIVGISRGPVITMFEIQPAPGVKVSSIVNLQDNLALRLAASRIRIVAPIPGKQAIGIEVPNKKRSIVSYSELVSSEEFTKADYEIPVILGKDISGSNQIIDLTRTPHLLIAGSTGSGKSVCVNSLICSILYQRSPREVKLIMVDPKIVELKLYNDIPHLLTPVITESKRAFQAVQWCLYEMERRYSLLDAMGVRDIKSFNKRIKERDIATTHLPYIVLVIDEFADLMATSGKELEAIVAR